MNEKLHKLRELVWPLLEEDINNDISNQYLTEEVEVVEENPVLKIEDENLDLALQLQGKIYQVDIMVILTPLLDILTPLFRISSVQLMT